MWEYLVEDAFYLTGRGVAVVGTLSGEVTNGECAVLHPAGRGADVIQRLDRDGQPTGYLFRCRACAGYLGYVDFT